MGPENQEEDYEPDARDADPDFFDDLAFCREFIRAQRRSYAEVHAEYVKMRSALQEIVAYEPESNGTFFFHRIAREALGDN